MRDLYHSALSAYDAEQTNRSGSCSGERGASYAGKYSFRDRRFGDTLHWRLSCQMSHPLVKDGRVSPKPRMARGDLGSLAVAHILVRYPVFGVGRLNGSLLGCLRKDVALRDTASRAWVGERRRGDGTFHVRRRMQQRTVPVCMCL
ncbi:hypothetical protein SBF1_1130005 [Candidatus Desulfosporosinus infrequens]|uniref:Uncharacterized protein n=1 Tax=Candidatus Desulfosporosinus infrequens TaxID=2043169 RepID=A0A2U3JYX0_9FIRM|nr:hypothetical protein SBF1_1130005 [Candidatus Desulfosporosinus infrequens]